MGPVRAQQQDSPTFTETERNARRHETAKHSFIPTMCTMHPRREMMLLSLTFSLDVLEKATSTAHVEDVVRALRDQSLDIDLSRKGPKTQKIVASPRQNLIESFQEDHCL